MTVIVCETTISKLGAHANTKGAASLLPTTVRVQRRQETLPHARKGLSLAWSTVKCAVLHALVISFVAAAITSSPNLQGLYMQDRGAHISPLTRSGAIRRCSCKSPGSQARCWPQAERTDAYYGPRRPHWKTLPVTLPLLEL
jgi:hypothetical protein